MQVERSRNRNFGGYRVNSSTYFRERERFGIVPVSDKKICWAGVVAVEKSQGKNPSIYKVESNSLFKTRSKLIANIIDKIPTSSINKIYVHDHNPNQKWLFSKGFSVAIAYWDIIPPKKFNLI